MVGTSRKTIFAGLIEIILEILVNSGCTFRSFDHDKADRSLVYQALIPQFSPVDVSLVMTDVYTMNLIALRIAYIAIKSTPTEAKRTD